MTARSAAIWQLSPFACRKHVERMGAGRCGHVPRFRSAASPFASCGLIILCLAALGCSKSAGTGQPSREVAAAATTASANDIPHVQILSTADQSPAASAVQRIDLGTIRQGDSLCRTIVIENRTSQAVTIDRFDSSCDCLTLSGIPFTIPASGEARPEIVVDEPRDDKFRGNLGISVKAFAVGRRLFNIEACLTVLQQERAASRTVSVQNSEGRDAL